MNNAQRLMDDLEVLVASMAPGTRLPSVRTLIALHGVSPVTLQRAMERLERKGRVVRRAGVGVFVAAQPSVERTGSFDWQTLTLGPAAPWVSTAESLLFAADSPEIIHLHSGHFDTSLQPTVLLKQRARRLLEEPDVWSRVPLEGVESLRAWFASEVGPDVTAGDVLVTGGGQAALFTCLRALAAAGDPVVVESPTYTGFIAAALSLGVHLVPVPTGADGVDPGVLAEALRSSGAKVVYLQPRHANPTGAVLSADRRAAVLDTARRSGAFIIEDDWVRDLDFEEPTPPPLAAYDIDGHVLYVRSLTKNIAPGLRIGAIVARGPVRARIRAVRGANEFFTSPLLQRIAEGVIRAPSWSRYLEKTRSTLRTRRDVLWHALETELPQLTVQNKPRGGFHIWVRLPDGVDDVELSARARSCGVTVIAGSSFFIGEPNGAYLRLSYAGCDEPQLREGVSRLRQAVATFTVHP